MAEPPPFRTVFAAALAVRLVTVLLGILAAQHPGAHPPAGFVADQYARVVTPAAWPVEAWYRWDALWYLHVGTHGYADSDGPDGQHGAAFLPLLPAVFAAAALLGLNVYWVGVIVPNLAAAAGVAVLTRLAVRMTGDRGTGPRTFVLVNAFPSAFFLSAPYQEGFGLLFTALALSAWHSGRGARAGVFAGLGCLARMTGAGLGAAAVGAWLVEGPRTRAGLARAAAVLLGCAAGVLAGWAVLWAAVGDPLLGIRSHAGWGRLPASPANIPRAFATVSDPASPQWFAMSLVLLVSAAGVVTWVRRGAFWGLATLIPVIQLASTGTFLSGHRLVLAALPGFIELAALLRNRLAFAGVVAVFLVFQFHLLSLYVTWRFAG